MRKATRFFVATLIIIAQILTPLTTSFAQGKTLRQTRQVPSKPSKPTGLSGAWGGAKKYSKAQALPELASTDDLFPERNGREDAIGGRIHKVRFPVDLSGLPNYGPADYLPDGSGRLRPEAIEEHRCSGCEVPKVRFHFTPVHLNGPGASVVFSKTTTATRMNIGMFLYNGGILGSFNASGAESTFELPLSEVPVNGTPLELGLMVDTGNSQEIRIGENVAPPGCDRPFQILGEQVTNVLDIPLHIARGCKQGLLPTDVCSGQSLAAYGMLAEAPASCNEGVEKVIIDVFGVRLEGMGSDPIQSCWEDPSRYLPELPQLSQGDLQNEGAPVIVQNPGGVVYAAAVEVAQGEVQSFVLPASAVAAQTLDQPQVELKLEASLQGAAQGYAKKLLAVVVKRPDGSLAYLGLPSRVSDLVAMVSGIQNAAAFELTADDTIDSNPVGNLSFKKLALKEAAKAAFEAGVKHGKMMATLSEELSGLPAFSLEEALTTKGLLSPTASATPCAVPAPTLGGVSLIKVDTQDVTLARYWDRADEIACGFYKPKQVTDSTRYVVTLADFQGQFTRQYVADLPDWYWMEDRSNCQGHYLVETAKHTTSKHVVKKFGGSSVELLITNTVMVDTTQGSGDLPPVKFCSCGEGKKYNALKPPVELKLVSRTLVLSPR